MGALAMTALLAAGASFPQLIQEIRVADYRGDRAELKQLAVEVGGVKDPKLTAFRHYWKGFALWRRAINGVNETPLPADVEADTNGAIAAFRAAQLASPDWVEPRIGIIGAASILMFVAKNDPPRQKAVLKEFMPLLQEIKDRGGSTNPRALWLQGQSQAGVWKDPALAVTTFQRGVEAALAEARAPAEPPWVPRWGGPENLMNLSFVYTHSTLANRELALAYARGALVAAPEWHYVRDILWEQALRLPEAASPAPQPPARPERPAQENRGSAH